MNQKHTFYRRTSTKNKFARVSLSNNNYSLKRIKPLNNNNTNNIGDFHRVVADVHRRLSDFIHAVVVHRRDEAIRVWRNSIREDPMVHPYKWLGPDLVPPGPFLQCVSPILRLVGVLADPVRIDEEFRKAWLPYFCRSGQRETSLEEFNEVEGWLPLLHVISLPQLTGEMLADVVRRKGATAGSLDGWGWRELKVLPVAWFDGLARILSKVEEVGVWPDGLLDASTKCTCTTIVHIITVISLNKSAEMHVLASVIVW